MNITTQINSKFSEVLWNTINVTVIIEGIDNKKIKFNLNLSEDGNEIIGLDILGISKNYESSKTKQELINYYFKRKENFKIILERIDKKFKICDLIN